MYRSQNILKSIFSVTEITYENTKWNYFYFNNIHKFLIVLKFKSYDSRFNSIFKIINTIKFTAE